MDVLAFPLRCGIIRKGVWWYIDVGLADPIRARSDLNSTASFAGAAREHVRDVHAKHTQEVNDESENALLDFARTVGGRLGPTSNRSETRSRCDPR